MGACGSICEKKETPGDIERHQIRILQDAEYKETPQMMYNFTKAKVIKVYDGDTFWVAAWVDSGIYRFSVRLYGIDCPEMRGGTEKTKEEAKKSKQYVVERILDKIVDIHVLNHRVIDGKKIEEKYGRLLAHVSIDGSDLCEEMLKLGLGKPYFGGKKG